MNNGYSKRRWINTRVESVWDEAQQRYVTQSCEGYWYEGPMALAGHDPPNWVQGNYRWHDDVATFGTNWLSNENAAPTVSFQNGDVVRLRIDFGDDASASFENAETLQLQYRVDTGGGFGSWTNMPADGGGDPVHYYNGAATQGTNDSTQRLSGIANSTYTGSFNEYSENGATGSDTYSDQYGEFEFCLRFDPDNANGGDRFQFRVITGTSDVPTINNTPDVTIVAAPLTATGSITLGTITASGQAQFPPRVWLNTQQTKTGADEMTVTAYNEAGTSITFSDPPGGKTGSLFLGVEDNNGNLGWIAVTVNTAGVKTASGSVTLEVVTASGAVIQLQSVTGAINLEQLTASGTVETINKASGAITLEGPTASGTAGLVLDATGNITLDELTVTGVATAGALLTATGSVTLAEITASGTVTQTQVATGNITLESPTAAGTVVQIQIATGTVTLQGPTAVGTVVQTLKPSGAITLDALQVTGVANASALLTATGNVTLGEITATGSVTQTQVATGNITLGQPTAAGTVVQIQTATGAVTLEQPTASGSASQILKPSGTIALAELNVSGTASKQGTKEATGNITLEQLTVAGAVSQVLKPSGAVTLDPLTVSGQASQILVARGAAGGTWGYTGGTTNSGNSASASVTHGQTINAGDLVVAYVHSNSDGTAISPDQSWDEEIGDVVPTGETCRHAIYWKIAGSEPSSYSWTVGSAQWRVCIKVFTTGGGVPVKESSYVSDTGSAANNINVENLSNVDPVSNNSLSVIGGGQDNRGIAEAYTQATSPFGNVIGDKSDQSTAMAHNVYATGTSIPTSVTFSPTDSSDGLGDPSYGIHVSFVFQAGGPTLPELTVSGIATASEAKTAVGVITLEGPTASGSVTQTQVATGSVALGSPTTTGSVTQTLKPSGAITLDELTVTGSATKQTLKEATGNITLNSPTVSGQARQILKPSGTITLDIPTASGQVVQTQLATGSINLDVLVVTGTATKQGQLPASGNITLETITASGQVVQTQIATGAVNLSELTAAGTVITVNKATGAITLESPTVAGSVTQTLRPSGAVTLEQITASGFAGKVLDVAGSITLEGPTASGSATQRQVVNGNIALGAITASGIATKAGEKPASGNITLEGPTVTGTVIQTQVATGAATLPPLIVTGVATNGDEPVVEQGGGSGGHGAVVLPPRPKDAESAQPQYDAELAELAALALIVIDSLEQDL